MFSFRSGFLGGFFLIFVLLFSLGKRGGKIPPKNPPTNPRFSRELFDPKSTQGKFCLDKYLKWVFGSEVAARNVAIANDFPSHALVLQHGIALSCLRNRAISGVSDGTRNRKIAENCGISVH